MTLQLARPGIAAADVDAPASANRLRLMGHGHPPRRAVFAHIEPAVRSGRVAPPRARPTPAPVRTVRPTVRRSPCSIAIRRPRHLSAIFIDHSRAAIHQVNLQPWTIEHERRKRTWTGRRSDHPGTLFGEIPMPSGIGPCGRWPTRGLRGDSPRQQEKKNPRPHALTLRRRGRTVNAR